MSEKKTKFLTEVELEFMSRLWDLGEATVRDVRVYRDVYYTNPIGLTGRRNGDRPMRLASGEYYVLGDNSPVSEDSRTWPEPGAIDAKLLIGKPLVAIPCLSASMVGGWRRLPATFTPGRPTAPAP